MLSMRIEPEFHRQLRQFAADKDASVSAVIKTAVELYLQKNAH